jgi:hypothetical protein
MIFSSTPQPLPSQNLLRYLQHQVGLSDKALSLGVRQAALEQAPLPIVLWRFGLLSLAQLDEVLAWQDRQP